MVDQDSRESLDFLGLDDLVKRVRKVRGVLQASPGSQE